MMDSSVAYIAPIAALITLATVYEVGKKSYLKGRQRKGSYRKPYRSSSFDDSYYGWYSDYDLTDNHCHHDDSFDHDCGSHD